MRHTTLATAILLAVAWPTQGALIVNANVASQASSALEVYKANTPLTTSSAPVSTAAPDLATLTSAVLAGNYTSRLANVTRSRCPRSCSSAGMVPGGWFVYNSVDRLDLCNSTMLLDFSLFNPLDDPNTRIRIAACTADLEAASSTLIAANATCQSNSVNQTEVTSSIQLASSGSSSSENVADVVASLNQLRAFSTLSEPGCNETIRFAYSGDVAVGLYVGSGLANQGVITSVLEQLSTQVQSDGSISEDLVVQLCDSRTARYSLGVFVNTNSDLSSVQLGLQSWRNSSCITTMDNIIPAWQNVTFSVPSLLQNSSTISNLSTTSNTTTLQSRNGKLLARSDCTTVKVVSGDSCASLAAECGISPAQFTIFNPSSTECSSLAVGERVCCSEGTLPDDSPQPDANGNCFVYLVVTGDSCSAIAATNDITIDDLESFNTDTWGWNDCADLLADYNICLSKGFPPMPTVVENSVCGPQVPGTPTAPAGTDLTTLNECPLNACCDIWGQCGTTTEFCIASNSSSGAPGTAAPGQNGCISNCGTALILSGPPAEVFSIAYFEAFDITRPCLRMSVDQIDTTKYTHIHFAFAGLNADFSVDATSIVDQLPTLQAMTGVKRIVSFGGWAFSTDPSTYNIFRNAVSSEANIEVLITNIVAFLNEYDLDGVDWDWEYPDEPDIPGIPAGTTADSTGYFLLLALLKDAMPAGKTVSMTAPASFWYLQHFPIQAMAQVVDYIVYMTYDLHGQWDYGNIFSDPGCPTSGCLRSHVNLTETINALSMITKAGVPSNKVAVGVTSYARSFQMTTTGCWTEECTFTGPLSGAIPGPCTETAGYISDYELGLVVSSDLSAQQLWDDNSYSNILLYQQETQWAAYMNDTNKATRMLLYQDLTFLGTADWAVDLQSEDGDGDGNGSGPTSGSGIVYVDSIIFVEPSPVIDCFPPCTFVIPPSSVPTPTTISFAPIATSFVLGGSTITSVSPLPITPSVISFFSVPIASGVDSSTFALTSSLLPDPLTISAGGATTTIILPPVTGPFSGPEVVIISEITFTVFGGSITFSSTPLSIPAETNTAQTVTINGIVVSIPAITQTLTDVEVLPSTVVTSGDITQTFSEAQFTQFATISSQTIITTSFTTSQTSGSSNGGSSTSSTTLAAIILLTIPVQTGGFYWSPIPLPTGKPFPIPNFPPFPPIPDPHCFKLFGIFSIDCPPDKSQPTTAYHSGPPHPTCTANCGTLCTVNCVASDSGSSSDKPTSTSSSSSSSTSSCDTSLSTGTGFCSNGNFPYWDVGSQTLNCDMSQAVLDVLGGDSFLSSCQQDADNDPTDAEDAINEALDCCSSGDTVAKRSSGAFGLDIFRRATPKICPNLPAVPYYKANPPQGSCHSTYTCTGSADKYPNVCANAKSAISSRSRTSILTFNVGSELHDTGLYPQGKMGFKGNVGNAFVGKILNGIEPSPGWGLINCEIEEYPFGSGNPFRTLPLSQNDVMRDAPDNQRAVNRLIPQKENGLAGSDLATFYKAAGAFAANALGVTVAPKDKSSISQFADGLVYCMEFEGLPATNDDAGYLLDSTAHNICAQPYGIEFTLVTQAYSDVAFPPVGSTWNFWDPWFNVPNTGRLTQQVVRRVANQPDQLFNLPPQYCYSPSPGIKRFDTGTNTWELVVDGIDYGYGAPRDDPGTDGANLKCIDVPGGNPTKRSISVVSNVTVVTVDLSSEDMPVEQTLLNAAASTSMERFSMFSSSSVKNTFNNWVRALFNNIRRSLQAITVAEHTRTKSTRTRNTRIQPRQAALGVDGGGSFTDPNAFQNFFCPNDDYDPCANDDSGCDGSDGFPPYSLYASAASTTYNGPTIGLSGGGFPTSIPSSGAVGTTQPGGGGASNTGGGGVPTTTVSPTTTPPPVTTPFATCTHFDEDPDEGVTSAYCICSGSTLAESLDTAVTPANSCAYTALPGSGISAPIQTTVVTQSSICSVCTFVGLSETCTSLQGCTVSHSATPTTSTSFPYPTNTAEDVGGAFCYTAADGNFVEFTADDSMNVISAFCAANHVLQPGNTFGFNEGDIDNPGYTVFASASWATDQTGCGTEGDFPFNANSDECLEGWSTDFFCTDEDGSGPDPTTSFGGGYVLKPPGNIGCILITLSASSATNSKRELSYRNVTEPLAYNITTGNANLTALRQGAGGPSVWTVPNNSTNTNRKHLFNQTALSVLINGTASFFNGSAVFP